MNPRWVEVMPFLKKVVRKRCQKDQLFKPLGVWDVSDPCVSLGQRAAKRFEWIADICWILTDRDDYRCEEYYYVGGA